MTTTLDPFARMAVKEHQIICSSAFLALQDIEKESIQCCITSPPYWKSAQPYDGLGKEPSWVEYQLEMIHIFGIINTVLKQGGYFWLITGYGSAGFKPGLQWILASLAEKIGLLLIKEIIWDKTGSANGTFDYIFCFRKPDNATPSPDRFEKEIWPETEYMDTGAGWATIPDRFLNMMIGHSTKEGDIILDPFAGSGTTAKMAKKRNRLSISIEIEKTLIPLIEKNLDV